MPTNPIRWCRLAVALGACALAASAAAQEPAAPTPGPSDARAAAEAVPAPTTTTSGPGSATAPASPAEAATTSVPAGPPWKGRFAALAGWGYYEVTHLAVSYHVDERAAFSLLGGYGAAGDQTTWTAGATFAHALFGPVWTLQPGWNLKAIYWTRSDASYDWQNMTVVLGAYLARDLGPRLRLALDGGVALSWALQSDRKQDFTFGSPTRWNGSVCLEISYRLGGP